MKEIKKFDCTYRTGNENGSLTFEVIPDEERDVPETLFKYHKFNKYSLDALLNGYIYAAHPNEFNDPFDCHAKLINFDNQKKIEEFLKDIPDIKYLIKTNPIRATQHAQVNFKAIVYRKLGIYCTTDNDRNIALWAYYTDHEGFQIEFDYSKFPFKFHGPFPINYRENLEPVNISDCSTELALLIQTNVKKRVGFNKEEEWRFIIESEEDMVTPREEGLEKLGGRNRIFDYPLSAIKRIRLGARFFRKSEIKPDLKANSIRIELFYDVPNKSKFLQFLMGNEILTGLIPPNPFNELNFLFGRLVQIDRRTFDFHPVGDIKNIPQTLHEAIVKLLEQKEKAMTAKEIADALNQNGWYKKADGSLIDASQIHARKNKYPDLFEIDDSVKPMKIGLKQ